MDDMKIRQKIESETLHIPGLDKMKGKEVEIIIRECASDDDQRSWEDLLDKKQEASGSSSSVERTRDIELMKAQAARKYPKLIENAGKMDLDEDAVRRLREKSKI